MGCGGKKGGRCSEKERGDEINGKVVPIEGWERKLRIF